MSKRKVNDQEEELKRIKTQLLLLEDKMLQLKEQNRIYLSKYEFFKEIEIIAGPLNKNDLGLELEQNASYSKNKVGYTFPIKNRDSSSKKICSLFFEQDNVRRSFRGYSEMKRSVIVPVCLGMAGTGKSTAASRAVAEYTQSLDLSNYVGDDRELLQKLATASNCANYQIGRTAHVLVRFADNFLYRSR